MISGEVKEDRWWCFIIRYLVALALSLPWVYLGCAIGKSQLGPYSDLFLAKFIPLGLAGLFAFCFADMVNSMLGLF